MSERTRTENDALIEQAALSAKPDELTPGGIYAYKTREGVKLIDLTGPEHTGEVDRKKGTVTVEDVASFAAYHSKHADPDTEIYANLDRRTITAVLNAHTPIGARFEDHRLTLRLTPTHQWSIWSNASGRYMGQTEFAEFLEDNLADIAREPVDAATMLEVATSFQAKTKVSFSSGTVLSSGDLRLNYQEETDATAGAKGQIVVPKKFAIGVAVFDDTDPYRIEARFRHRIEGGKLKLAYILERPQDVMLDAFKTIVTKVQEQLEVTVMRGEPARA
jgi:uncharacterized protein YfdQ (DUF2303 family)